MKWGAWPLRMPLSARNSTPFRHPNPCPAGKKKKRKRKTTRHSDEIGHCPMALSSLSTCVRVQPGTLRDVSQMFQQFCNRFPNNLVTFNVVWMAGGWTSLVDVARRVEAAAALVPVVGRTTAVPATGGGPAEAEAEEEWAAWWWGREAEAARSLLRVAREHERQERTFLRVGREDTHDDEEEDEDEENAEAADGAGDTHGGVGARGGRRQRRWLRLRAAELEEQLFRRSEAQARCQALAAHVGLVPAHLRALFGAPAG